MINNVNSRRHEDSEKIPSGARIFSESSCLLEFTLFIKYPIPVLMKLHEPYEKLTHYQVKRARKHAKLYGPGTIPENEPKHRTRLDMGKVDHFLEFANRPYFYQDVAYGSRILKLDSGEKIRMPNVVRTVTRSTMVKQYQSFCEEESFNPLSRSTLFKILDVREASQRR